jgi:hypothetical protein
MYLVDMDIELWLLPHGETVQHLVFGEDAGPRSVGGSTT